MNNNTKGNRVLCAHNCKPTLCGETENKRAESEIGTERRRGRQAEAGTPPSFCWKRIGRRDIVGISGNTVFTVLIVK